MRKKNYFTAGILLIIVAAISGGSMIVYAESGGEFTRSAKLEKKSIETSELRNFNYLLYIPENTDSTMPLIIYLHGGSGKGNDLDLLTKSEGFPQYIQDGRMGNIPSYVIIPQLPASMKGWVDIKVALGELIDFIINNYDVDSNRISLTGHSMGGTGAWEIAVSYPNLFSCVAPLSGSIRMREEAISALLNTPVWAFVGSNDTIVAPRSSVRFIEKLAKKSTEAKLTILDGATHFNVPRLTYLDEDINLIDWLVSNNKQANTFNINELEYPTE